MILAALAVSPAAAQRTLDVAPKPAPQRIALVIGNDSYARVSKLENARADARAMARALEQAGFNVRLALDVGRSELLQAVRVFKGQITGGSEVVFYYAGHAVQLGATNYLLPTDIIATNEEQVRDDGLPLQRVLDDITDQKARFSLAIIDACRDNPFPRVAGRSIGGTRGLAPTTAADGQMVIYSAGSGQTALDRLNTADRNPNGVFTRVFLQEMQRADTPVRTLLLNVRNQVAALAKAVGHNQVPAMYDQALGDFYFRGEGQRGQAVAPLPIFIPQPVVVPQPAAPAPPPAGFQDSATELLFWNSVKDTKSPAELQAYIERYPGGTFEPLARARLRSLQAAVSASLQQANALSAAEQARRRAIEPFIGRWIEHWPAAGSPDAFVVREAGEGVVIDAWNKGTRSTLSARVDGGLLRFTQTVGSTTLPYEVRPDTPGRLRVRVLSSGNWRDDVTWTAGDVEAAIKRQQLSATGCFIATAAYGSYLDPHVIALRRFRDDWLLASAAGRAFVQAYYQYSPRLAAWIEGSELLRGVARTLLAPVVFAVVRPLESAALAALLLGWFVLRARRPRRAS